jgi:hypothetical protein
MKYPLYLLLALTSACGDNQTVEITPDAPPAAQTIAISGTASQRSPSGAVPVSGVTVGAYANSDENTPVATSTTDTDGNYTLTIDTHGVALVGYLKATMPGMVDTYWYPPGAITADYAHASLNMLAPQTLDLLANTLCRANQDTTMGVIAVEVADAARTPVAGVTFTSDPAASLYCYDSGNFPSSTATATDTDGIGYLFNITGDTTVTATKDGSTFKANTIKSRGGALTTTLIQP